MSDRHGTHVGCKMERSAVGCEVLTKATPALYLNHRQLIKLGRKDSASLVAAKAKKREQEEKGLLLNLLRKRGRQSWQKQVVSC